MRAMPPDGQSPRAILRHHLIEAGKTVGVIAGIAAVFVGIAVYNSSPPANEMSRSPVPPVAGGSTDANPDHRRAEEIKQTVESVNAAGEALAERAATGRPATGAGSKSGGVQVPARTPPVPKPVGAATPKRVVPRPKGAGLAGIASTWLAIKEAQEEADLMAQEQKEQNDRQQQKEQGERQKLMESVRMDNALKSVVIEATVPDHNGWRSVIIRNPTDTDLKGLGVTVLRTSGQPGGVPQRVGSQSLADLPATRSVTIRSVARAPFAPAPLLGGKQISFQKGDIIQVSRGWPAVVKSYTIP